MSKQKNIPFHKDGIFYPSERAYVTQIEYKDDPAQYERIEGESMTEPNQSLTIQQILDRFKAGQKLPTNEEMYSDPQDFDSEDILQTVNSDLVDRMEKKEQIKSAIKSLEEEQEESEKLRVAETIITQTTDDKK